MATTFRYQIPVEQTKWKFEGQSDTAFTWEYEDGREKLLTLYDKGKKQQWDAAERLDWSQDLDPENPMMMDDRAIQIYGSPVWERLTPKERTRVRHHLQAQSLSQFMHGEQGALIATAKIVQTVPDADAKFYAATQVMDEARHVEAYARLLHDKFELAYPITPGLKALLESTISDRRWDMTYLGMQILIEGLALAAFQRIRDTAKNPLAAAVNAYVMQDVARLVLHDVGIDGGGQRVLGRVADPLEGGQGQALDEDLHAQIGHVPAPIADRALEKRLEPGGDRIGELELVVQEPGVGLDVARLVHDLGGRVELGVGIGDGLDDLGGGDEGALLAVHELGEGLGLEMMADARPLLGGEALPDWGAIDLDGPVIHHHGVLGVEVLGPVDPLGGIPLLLLALVVEGQELFAPVLVFPREGRIALAFELPLGLLDGNLVAERRGHVVRDLLIPESGR